MVVERVCTVVDGSVGHTEAADDDGAYDLSEVCGSPEEVGKSVGEALREVDLLRGGRWSYLENGQPVYLRVTIKIERKSDDEVRGLRRRVPAPDALPPL